MFNHDEMLQFHASLTKVERKVMHEAKKVLSKTLYDISGEAKQLAPVDTGFLKNSISTDLAESRDRLRGEVGPSANYGGYVENGTSKQRAQPYLRPATDRVLPSMERALAQIGGEIIK